MERVVLKFPHPPFGHLLPLEETGEGFLNFEPSPAFFAGEGGANAPDEGPRV